MRTNLLIATSRDILRAGLRTIFIADERVEHVYEATTREDIQAHLHTNPSGLIIANQSLVTDITTLPPGRFVILASEFDIVTFQAAYKHGAKGYLLENSSVELLRTILCLNEGAFLIEPAITAQVIENLSYNARFTVKEELLTPREKEIIGLLREGIDRHTIAKQLHISEATLKTHVKNIAKKRDNTNL